MADDEGIKWQGAEDLSTARLVKSNACALVADLRDPLILPLLRPAPTAFDYRDEARPGASDRAYFLARRAALRSLVGLCANCRAEDVIIGYDEPGAPRVREPEGYYVSASGRGVLAALAVSRHPVGIDLEILHKGVEIVKSVLHRVERAELADLYDEHKQRQFLRIWTAKEAFLKAVGLGLNIDPAEVLIDFSGGTIERIFYRGQSDLLAGVITERRFADAEAVLACVTLRAPASVID